MHHGRGTAAACASLLAAAAADSVCGCARLFKVQDRRKWQALSAGDLCFRSQIMAKTNLRLVLVMVAACGLTVAQNTFGTTYGDTGNGTETHPRP